MCQLKMRAPSGWRRVGGERELTIAGPPGTETEEEQKGESVAAALLGVTAAEKKDVTRLHREGMAAAAARFS